MRFFLSAVPTEYITEMLLTRIVQFGHRVPLLRRVSHRAGAGARAKLEKKAAKIRAAQARINRANIALAKTRRSPLSPPMQPPR